MIILGAGMAGCLMGFLNPSAKIYEASEKLPDTHRAVLRFRDRKISQATGIPFKKVKVYKTIWVDGKERMLGPQWINAYSKKVTGRYQPRSIVNLDTVERYIAPSDFHLILADMIGNNIHFNHKIVNITEKAVYFDNALPLQRDIGEPIISTMPMSAIARVTNEKVNGDAIFRHQEIIVTRFKVKDCDVYQTVYYPKDNNAYRATITGDDLIVESIGNMKHNMLVDVLKSFGLSLLDLNTEFDLDCIDLDKAIQSTTQYGKISPIDEKSRKDFILMLTVKHNIYSAGRFACWRNILLDDVYDDNFKIKAMMNSELYDTLKGVKYES